MTYKRKRRYHHRTKKSPCPHCGARFWPQGLHGHVRACEARDPEERAFLAARPVAAMAAPVAAPAAPVVQTIQATKETPLFVEVRTHLPLATAAKLESAARQDGCSVAEFLRTAVAVVLE